MIILKTYIDKVVPYAEYISNLEKKKSYMNFEGRPGFNCKFTILSYTFVKLS